MDSPVRTIVLNMDEKVGDEPELSDSDDSIGSDYEESDNEEVQPRPRDAEITRPPEVTPPTIGFRRVVPKITLAMERSSSSPAVTHPHGSENMAAMLISMNEKMGMLDRRLQQVHQRLDKVEHVQHSRRSLLWCTGNASDGD